MYKIKRYNEIRLDGGMASQLLLVSQGRKQVYPDLIEIK